MTQNQEPAQDPPHVETVLRLAAAMQRTALLLGVPVAVAAVVAAAVLRGVPGAVGAVVAAVIGLGIGVFGTFVMRGTARATPAGVMIGAMTSFAGKIGLLLAFLVVFDDTTLFDNQVFGISLMGVTAAYIAGEVAGFVRTKLPTVDV